MENKWKKSSPELEKVLDAALMRFTCDKRPMFGSPCFWINRNMFAGVHGDNIFIRLPEADRKELLGGFPGAAQFEPIKGHFMKEYVVLPREVYNNPGAFEAWLMRAHAYAASLPPKVKKPKK
jgi:TfoX/Sxy family transcriptional regulator of competence genes